MICIDEEKDSEYIAASKLILATQHRTYAGKEFEDAAYSLTELKRIALYLLNYVETEQIDDDEG